MYSQRVQERDSTNSHYFLMRWLVCRRRSPGVGLQLGLAGSPPTGCALSEDGSEQEDPELQLQLDMQLLLDWE